MLLQYNPFMYGRWGFAPRIPVLVGMLRHQRPRPLIAMLVHEPFVPMLNWRWTIMGLWQRMQLEAIRLNCDVTFAAVEQWARRLALRRPRRPCFILPVGSNLPDRSASRARLRTDEQMDEGTVVAVFGTTHPSRLLGPIVLAVNALAGRGHDVVLLNLGDPAPRLEGLDKKVRVKQPGSLSQESIAEWLSTADVFLAPFVDGVSTRRTTLMAALQHGLPIIGTNGQHTDTVLRDATAAMKLVPPNRAELFREAAVRVIESPEERARMAKGARALYFEHFDWPVVARRLESVLATYFYKRRSVISHRVDR
jgi:glycosyltransferase involved in cell wall biosynthesis